MTSILLRIILIIGIFSLRTTDSQIFYDEAEEQLHFDSKMQLLAKVINTPTGDLHIDADWNYLSKNLHNGNICPFYQKILPKILKSEHIRIVIVGGSMTYGADLPKRDKNKWSTLFHGILNSGWYSGTFEVHNIAIPATNVDTWTDKITSITIGDSTVGEVADIIIVDEQVNDQVFALEALPHLYHAFIKVLVDLPSHPAILFTQTFVTLGDAFNEIRKRCPRPDQWGGCCGGYYWCKSYWNMSDYVVPTLNHFGIPYISYRDLFWPEYENNTYVRFYWNGGPHPDIRTHKMFAKMVAFLFYMQLNESFIEYGESRNGRGNCGTDGNSTYYHQQEKLKQLLHCPSKASTFMHASDRIESVNSFKLLSHDNCSHAFAARTAVTDDHELQWRYYNDSRLKFGWILEINRNDFESRKLCSDNGSLFTWCDRALDFYRLSLEVACDFV